MSNRSQWTDLSDQELLKQCEVDTYRASGPGGQKRNKTSSAVRLRHLPSGLLVIAEESRSQPENKTKALKRLRKALYLSIRESPDLATVLEHEVYQQARSQKSRLKMNPKNPLFWPMAGLMLDVLVAVEARVSEAAQLLDLSTANLIDFLQSDPKLWEQTGQIRQEFGQKPLRS